METEHSTTAGETSTVSKPRIAVLPFENLSSDPDLDYYCEGIAAEILVCLARTPGVRVIARSALFDVDWDGLDVREAGKLLNATAMLGGSILKSGSNLTADVHLTDVESGRQIWSKKIDRDVLDVFVVQDAIIGGVVRALSVDVMDSRIQNLRKRHAANVDAYELFLRGRHYYWQFSHQGVEKALAYFEEATSIDDTYALAYCGQADCYWYLFKYVEPLDEYCQKADKASLRALELAPDLAEAHASRGLAHSLVERFDECAEQFDRAIELDPMLFEARFLYARCCFSEGLVEKAAGLFEEANRIRPEDYQSLLLAGQAYEVLGNDRRASDLRRHGVDIAEEHLFLNPRETRALYMGANGLVALGETDRGITWLQRARALEPSDPMMLYNAGCIYALVGENNEAIDCLEKAVDGGLRQRGWFENDPNLDSLRNDPRFIRLGERLL